MCSLDAVVVALAGQEAFAHVAGVSLGAADRLLLGLCAWLAYCGDRLLDGRRIKTRPRWRAIGLLSVILNC